MTPAFLAQRDGLGTVLNLSVERHTHPDSESLSRADAAWPQRLRRILRAALKHRGSHTDLIETAELLLTELVTNALRHGIRRNVDIRAYFQDGQLVIKVDDGSPIRPKMRDAGPDDEGGRGLALVEAMADAWGVSDDGSTTWCTLPIPAPSRDYCRSSPQS